MLDSINTKEGATTPTSSPSSPSASTPSSTAAESHVFRQRSSFGPQDPSTPPSIVVSPLTSGTSYTGERQQRRQQLLTPTSSPNYATSPEAPAPAGDRSNSAEIKTAETGIAASQRSDVALEDVFYSSVPTNVSHLQRSMSIAPQVVSLEGPLQSQPGQQHPANSSQQQQPAEQRNPHDHFHNHGHPGTPGSGPGGTSGGWHTGTGDGDGGGGGGGNSKPSIECVPMKLDAFVLNQHIFTKEYFVAPLAIPDHSTFLPGVWSAPDAVPRVDVDAAYPWWKNSRIADITQAASVDDAETGGAAQDGRLREERLGVYLHWCLPRRFRGATAQDREEDPTKTVGREAKGSTGGRKGTDESAPVSGVEHASVPDRWIIMRFIHEAIAVENNAPKAPALTAFIVESNRIRHLSSSQIADVEVEAAPFIDRTLPVEKQDEVFMGIKRAFDDDWQDPAPDGMYHTPLRLLDSANPLLADFTHHNANVFSIHDDLTWMCEGECAKADQCKSVWHAKSAKVSYAVFGFYSSSNPGMQKTIVHGSLLDVLWKRDKAPAKITAEVVSKQIRERQPIALGGDTLEALETYLRCLPSKFEWSTLLGQMWAAISHTGKGTGGLVDISTPDNSRSGYKPVGGGWCWRFNNDSSEGQDPTKPTEPHAPSAAEMQAMYTLDRHQAYSDSLERQECHLRHVLFCEWWKRRSRIPGGLWGNPKCRRDSDARLREALIRIERVKNLRKLYSDTNRLGSVPGLQQTPKKPFYSRTPPAVIIGALGNAWPSEFVDEKQTTGRDLRALPFRGVDGGGVVQEWLKSLIQPGLGQREVEVCTVHGMRLFFGNAASRDSMKPELKGSPSLQRLPELFEKLENLGALHWTAPGWVRNAVDTLMQEWVYTMNGQPVDKLLSPPLYSSPEEGASQFFQLGHRINQDARLNAYYAINSADWRGHHETAQWAQGDRTESGSVQHSWRPATEYEDPVWGWLIINFRSRGIQIYNAAGESMGEALLPNSIYSKVYWQVYYAEGDLSESDSQLNSQLRDMMQKMSDPKFLLGLWSMLADACQNISHDASGVNDHLSTLVGRPMALVNIGLALELATPVMQTQSYADIRKKSEITLDEYKFEVMLGHKSNLCDGLVGYWPSPGLSPSDMDQPSPMAAQRPDASTIYTHFGYPGRRIVDQGNVKPDRFTSPSHSPVYVSPYHVDPSDFPHDAPAYARALRNHSSSVILGAIIDPFQPVNIATGILPSTSLKLAPWVVSRTLDRLRLVFRGGPLLARGDLVGIDDDGTGYGASNPQNRAQREAQVPNITEGGAGGGDWTWLQPLLQAGEQGDAGVDGDMPVFVPYSVKGEPASQFPLPLGPHTVLEGFYKFGLKDMSFGGELLPGKTNDALDDSVEKLLKNAEEARTKYEEAQAAS